MSGYRKWLACKAGLVCKAGTWNTLGEMCERERVQADLEKSPDDDAQKNAHFPS